MCMVCMCCMCIWCMYRVCDSSYMRMWWMSWHACDACVCMMWCIHMHHMRHHTSIYINAYYPRNTDKHHMHIHTHAPHTGINACMCITYVHAHVSHSCIQLHHIHTHASHACIHPGIISVLLVCDACVCVVCLICVFDLCVFSACSSIMSLPCVRTCAFACIIWCYLCAQVYLCRNSYVLCTHVCSRN